MASKRSLSRIDRRFIYLLSALAVVIPLIRPLMLPIGVSDEVRNTYEKLMEIPDGSVVLVGFDYEPAAISELSDQTVAVLNLLESKDVKLITLTCFPESTKFPETSTKETYEKAGKKYGVDYVNLGFYAGSEASLAAFCENPRAVFQSDSRGNPIDSIALTKGLTGINDFSAAISFNGATSGAGTSPEMWIRQVNIAHGKSIIMGVQSIMGPSTRSFVQSGNIEGLMVGLKAAAEIEQLSRRPGTATAAMDALSIAHMLIVVLVILGNIGLLIERKGNAVPRVIGGAEK